MPISHNLSLEQQFTLIAYKNRIKQLSLEKSRQYLKMTLKYMLIKDNLIKFLVHKNKL